MGGIAVATTTPFERGGWGIDYGFIERHLKLLAREGAHGIVPVGTNGEFPSLSHTEKKKVLEAAAAARGDLFMAAGCGSCSMPEVLDLVAFAAEAGADAALVPPPFYFRDAGEAGVIDFYRRVLAGTDLPVILYHVPAYTGIAISYKIIETLLEYPNLEGVKDSAGDIRFTRELIERYPQLKIFGGSDGQVGGAIGAGAAGVISGVANAFPRLLRDVWEARARGGDTEGPGEKVRAVRGMITAFPWVAATKTAIALRGLPETFVRPPQIDLTKGQQRDLKARLLALGLV